MTTLQTNTAVSLQDTNLPSCRFCNAPLEQTLVDLGKSPLCERLLNASQLRDMEPFYPLHVFVCEACLLVQLEQFVPPSDIFTDYAYFSSYSDSWLRHAQAYVDMAVDRFALDESSVVVEIASNDGYLLQYFVQRGIPALGIEPAGNVAQAARARGVETLEMFFGSETARELTDDGIEANLIIANNVLAQVPDLNDFVQGMKILLKHNGVITMEFPHLLRLLEDNQFDTIYHEHFSYFSATTVQRILRSHGLVMFDVQVLASHGGSLRVFAGHCEDGHVLRDSVHDLLQAEEDAGLTSMRGYAGFQAQVEQLRCDILSFLLEAREMGHQVVGYGAPGKGNTLLNYCGIRRDLLAYTVDRNPHKHGRFLPGTHIPIHPVEMIDQTQPDYVFILPWNLSREIVQQMSHIRKWGGRFVVPIPKLTIIE